MLTLVILQVIDNYKINFYKFILTPGVLWMIFVFIKYNIFVILLQRYLHHNSIEL